VARAPRSLMTPHRLAALLVLLPVVLGPGHAAAHDASAWGGLFRTRDAGATWLQVNPGSFVSGALAVAVSPADPLHLLLATDTGVSRSRNGGRDWMVEGPGILAGPAFAAAFDIDGRRALVAGAAAIFRSDGDGWQRLRSPSGSMPARALVSGGVRGRIYLAGRSGLYRTDDWGQSWVNIGRALHAAYTSAVTVPRERPDHIYAVAGGRAWASTDAGQRWEPRSDGLPTSEIDALALDPSDANRLWSVVADQVFRSEDQGRRWRPVGQPVPERPVVARGLAVVDSVIVMATDRGVFRSSDDGARWTLGNENLPAHLEAGMLARDPVDPATVYAGFALNSREMLARRAIDEVSMLERITPTQLAGGVGVLVVALIGVVAGVLRFARAYHATPPPIPR
jgi:photosystem II stability/assembly factor-like uncharacterized protein